MLSKEASSIGHGILHRDDDTSRQHLLETCSQEVSGPRRPRGIWRPSAKQTDARPQDDLAKVAGSQCRTQERQHGLRFELAPPPGRQEEERLPFENPEVDQLAQAIQAGHSRVLKRDEQHLRSTCGPVVAIRTRRKPSLNLRRRRRVRPSEKIPPEHIGTSVLIQPEGEPIEKLPTPVGSSQ
ncbi:MAG: hypothetical protein NXI35_25195 [bacterium]|nr:hypothetical protein [bacterium]